MKEEIHPIASGFGILLGIASAIFSLWCTYIAFTGGTIPIVNWTMKGGIGMGLVWLMFIDPIILTVSYWIGMIAFLPIAVIFSKKEK